MSEEDLDRPTKQQFLSGGSFQLMGQVFQVQDKATSNGRLQGY